MTQFKDLELLYNQFSNLTDEISSMIELEEFELISNKVNYKERLMTRIANAKKTTKLTEEEQEKTLLMEKTLREKEHANIEALEKMQAAVGLELRKSRNKLKVNHAYETTSREKQGVFIDIEE